MKKETQALKYFEDYMSNHEAYLLAGNFKKIKVSPDIYDALDLETRKRMSASDVKTSARFGSKVIYSTMNQDIPVERNDDLQPLTVAFSHFPHFSHASQDEQSYKEIMENMRTKVRREDVAELYASPGFYAWLSTKAAGLYDSGGYPAWKDDESSTFKRLYWCIEGREDIPVVKRVGMAVAWGVNRGKGEDTMHDRMRKVELTDIKINGVEMQGITGILTGGRLSIEAPHAAEQLILYGVLAGIHSGDGYSREVHIEGTSKRDPWVSYTSFGFKLQSSSKPANHNDDGHGRRIQRAVFEAERVAVNVDKEKEPAIPLKVSPEQLSYLMEAVIDARKRASNDDASSEEEKIFAELKKVLIEAQMSTVEKEEE